MAEFAAHGNHRLAWQGQVLVVRFAGIFNREGVQAVVASVAAALARQDGVVGLLHEITDWHGGTPEAFAYWISSVLGWVDAGRLVAAGDLYADDEQSFMGQSVRLAVGERIPYLSVRDDLPACLDWFAGLGLATASPVVGLPGRVAQLRWINSIL